MSEHQSPEKKTAVQMKEGEAESTGKQLPAPAFNLTAPPIQRQEAPGIAPATTAAPVADPAQVPGVVAEKTQLAAGPEGDVNLNQKYDDLVAETPATNVEIATWVLKAAGDDIGFVTWNTTAAKTNWEQIRDGKATGAVADPAAAEVLKALPTVVALVKARVNRYIAAGYTGTKETLQLGSFMNGRTGTHGDGQAIDINGLDFTTSAAKVLQLMKDLPSGKLYGFGLPGQGDFFENTKSLDAQKRVVEATGVAGTATGWRKFVTGNYSSTYTPAVPAAGGKPAVAAKWSAPVAATGTALSLYMKSQDIKDQVAAMPGAFVYPDNDNHIHVDTRN